MSEPHSDVTASRTQWSLISKARGDSEESLRALDVLAGRYRQWICDYMRTLGRRADSEDLTQEFFTRKFLRAAFLGSVKRGKGSFRTFLKLCVRRFVIDATRKRPQPGEGPAVVELDTELEEGGPVMELGSLDSPDRQIDQAWARTILSRARERLVAELTKANRRELGAYFLQELDEEPDLLTHQEIGSRLNLSAGAVTTSFYRFRERLKFLIRAEVEDTVSEPSELEEELRTLRGAFGSENPGRKWVLP
jgi:RNA polymerase sigma factor (sigma-70 family)